MIVLDASAAVDYALGTTRSTAIAQRLMAASRIHMPELMIVEVLSAVRRAVLRGELSGERAAVALSNATSIPAVRHRHAPLVQRAHQLSTRLSVYDAVYVALAEGLDATLVTLDRRLARQAESLVRVEVPA